MVKQNPNKTHSYHLLQIYYTIVYSETNMKRNASPLLLIEILRLAKIKGVIGIINRIVCLRGRRKRENKQQQQKKKQPSNT